MMARRNLVLAMALLLAACANRTEKEKDCADRAELAFHRILSQENEANSPGVHLMAGRTYKITYRQCMKSP